MDIAGCLTPLPPPLPPPHNVQLLTLCQPAFPMATIASSVSQKREEGGEREREGDRGEGRKGGKRGREREGGGGRGRE